jgi:hypothetical protein
MTYKFKILATVLLLAFSLPALAGSCPRDMKTIDAALAANPSVSAADMDRIKQLRTSGEQQHKSGNHSQSVADLHQAMKLLGIE